MCRLKNNDVSSAFKLITLKASLADKDFDFVFEIEECTVSLVYNSS
jgi:hypothetical protein